MRPHVAAKNKKTPNRTFPRNFCSICGILSLVDLGQDLSFGLLSFGSVGGAKAAKPEIRPPRLRVRKAYYRAYHAPPDKVGFLGIEKQACPSRLCSRLEFASGFNIRGDCYSKTFTYSSISVHRPLAAAVVPGGFAQQFRTRRGFVLCLVHE
jgi:hypothetical protein